MKERLGRARRRTCLRYHVAGGVEWLWLWLWLVIQRIVEVWDGALKGQPCWWRAEHREHWGWREA